MSLIYPTSGKAEILGESVANVASRRQIGYLPENSYFYEYLTAEESLAYYAGLFGYRLTRVTFLPETDWHLSCAEVTASQLEMSASGDWKHHR